MEAPLVRWLAAGVLALLVAACGGGTEYDVPAGSVQLVEDTVALGTVSRGQALDEVSSRVRFDVRQPSFVPDGGFRLVVVTAQMPNPIEALGNDGRSNAVAMLTWLTGKAESPETTRLDLFEFSRANEPPAGVPEAESNVAGARFYWMKTEGGGVNAVWITDDRTYAIEASGKEAPTQDETRRIFESLG